jgi:hypothetical protein
MLRATMRSQLQRRAASALLASALWLCGAAARAAEQAEPTCDAATLDRLDAAVEKACGGPAKSCGSRTSCASLKRIRAQEQRCLAAHEEIRSSCFPGAASHQALGHRAAAQSAEAALQRCQQLQKKRSCK